MRLPKPLLVLAALAAVAVSALYAYRYQRGPQQDNLAVLNYLPRDPDAVFYVDLLALRQSPFFAQLAAWVPQPDKDLDYTQFVQDTSFNFERDLDHLAIASSRSGNSSSLLVIGEGTFDRRKISAYALRNGTKHIVNGHETFFVPLEAGKSTLAFLFLSDRLLVASNGTQIPEELFLGSRKTSRHDDWRERFNRLAGSPVFAVIRQDVAATLAERAPGGLRSPQLSSLLAQLEWITIAAKPDADQLRLVAEGEAASEATSHQLADLLNGVVILAQAGLSDPKVRQQLAPEVRQACLDLLKSADISKLDRGETKSVRLVLSLTPQFLEAARHQTTFTAPPVPATPPSPRNAPTPKSAARSRKSGT
jgi:hypothetical protein